MKARIALFTVLFLALVSAAHVRWNIGWKAVEDDLRMLLGGERQTLYVGFLPVT